MTDSAEKLIADCRRQPIKWLCAREIGCQSELPRTSVVKIDYVGLMASDSKHGRVAAR